MGPNTMFTETATTRFHAHSRRMWTAIGCFAFVFFLGFVSMNCDPIRRRLPGQGQTNETETSAELEARKEHLLEEIEATEARIRKKQGKIKTYAASLPKNKMIMETVTREERETRQLNSVSGMDLAGAKKILQYLQRAIDKFGESDFRLK